MGLRRSQDDVAADVGVSAPHVDPPPDQIDVAHAQGSSLAPAKTRVTEKEHKHPPRAGYDRQVVNLLMGAHTKENMDRMYAEGRIEFTRTGRPRGKRYLDELPGTP